MLWFTLFKHFLLRNPWANQSQISYGVSVGWVNKVLIKTVLVTWPRWPPCPYVVKPKKIFFSETKRPMILNLGMHHQVLEYYQVCSNNDSGLTLTYFTARSNLVPYTFVWEIGKTMFFSETIVVGDLKLATDDWSEKKFLLTSKFCPLWLYARPLPRGYIHVLNHEKKCIKSDLKEISLKHATNV